MRRPSSRALDLYGLTIELLGLVEARTLFDTCFFKAELLSCCNLELRADSMPEVVRFLSKLELDESRLLSMIPVSVFYFLYFPFLKLVGETVVVAA